jgi:1,4-alpha-glucan branching enzyme
MILQFINFCRYDRLTSVLDHITETEESLEKFSRGYEKFGFILEKDSIIYREWAPGVSAAFLIGDFSNAF